MVHLTLVLGDGESELEDYADALIRNIIHQFLRRCALPPGTCLLLQGQTSQEPGKQMLDFEKPLRLRVYLVEEGFAFIATHGKPQIDKKVLGYLDFLLHTEKSRNPFNDKACHGKETMTQASSGGQRHHIVTWVADQTTTFLSSFA